MLGATGNRQASNPFDLLGQVQNCEGAQFRVSFTKKAAPRRVAEAPPASGIRRMSLIIGMYVREGIVMAADSRLTLAIPRPQPAGPPQTISVTASDSAKKLFHAPNNIGIATYGQADIGGIPVAGFVESFIIDKLKGNDLGPSQVAEELRIYFAGLGVRPITLFHVAGYARGPGGFEQEYFLVDPAQGNVSKLNPVGQQGATWGGESDVLQRLLNEVALIQAGGGTTPLPHFGVAFQYFTLQDAIDFAVYGIRSTIDTMRFEAREKTVGGPIDVLVITPDSSRWISQKQLVVEGLASSSPGKLISPD